MLIGPWGVQDGLGIGLVRSFFRLAVWDRFFGPPGLLLGSFWSAPGVVFGHLGGSGACFGLSWALLGSFWATLDIILQSYNPIFASTHRLTILSTCGSSALDNPARRTVRSHYIEPTPQISFDVWRFGRGLGTFLATCSSTHI